MFIIGKTGKRHEKLNLQKQNLHEQNSPWRVFWREKLHKQGEPPIS
jgi:hypothetical protein